MLHGVDVLFAQCFCRVVLTDLWLGDLQVYIHLYEFLWSNLMLNLLFLLTLLNLLFLFIKLNLLIFVKCGGWLVGISRALYSLFSPKINCIQRFLYRAWLL